MAFESLILDARGNPFQGTLDAIGGETVTDARAPSATLGALNAELVMDLNGKATAKFEVRITAMVATLVFEATLDGTNYYTVPAFVEQAETMTAALTAAAGAGTYVVAASAWRRVRCRVSAYTSGSAAVAARASEADFEIYARLIPSTLAVSATAAVNTNAVATLPAAGAGLFHYLTSIQITRANTSAAIVGSASLVYTTTNLPGSLAWTVGNAMAIGGQQIDVALTPVTPLKSSAANTATTITAVAAGATALARVNVTYYIGA